MAQSKSGRRWVHRDQETRCVVLDALEALLKDGWRMGRSKTIEENLAPEVLVDMFLKRG